MRWSLRRSHYLRNCLNGLIDELLKTPIVQMPKVEEPNTKAVRKALEKAKNIQLAVKAYKDPTSGLSLRAAASLYHCSKDSITNHLNDTPKHEYAPDVYIEQQKLSPAEEKAF